MIRDPVKYCAALWDWDFLRQCFVDNIGVSDLDGLVDEGEIAAKQGYVERFCHHLLFEATNVPNRAIKPGQTRGHAALVKVGFSIIYLWGKPNVFPVGEVQLWREFEDKPRDPVQNASEAALVGLVRKWFLHACRYPITPPPQESFFIKTERF
jgi:hypothetical protein